MSSPTSPHPTPPLPVTTGYDASKAPGLELKLVDDKGPAGFVFQTLPADPTRRGIYGHFTPPCNVTLSPGADPQTESSTSAKGPKTGEVRPGRCARGILCLLMRLWLGRAAQPHHTMMLSALAEV